MAYIGKVPAVAALTASDITDGIISNAKLAQDIMSAETELAVAPASTDEFLLSDAGVLKRVDASLVGKGKVLQVVETRLTAATASTTSGTFAAVSGLTAAITPASTSNKILIFFCATLISGNHAYMNLSRDSGSSYVGSGVAVSSRHAATFYGYADGNTSRPQSATILDSPATTSEITYQAYWRTNASTAYLNRTYNDVDGGYGGRGVSSITLMEIAG